MDQKKNLISPHPLKNIIKMSLDLEFFQEKIYLRK